MYKVLIGSHNYGLNDENSDKDYKAFVMPTFQDMYHHEYINKSITGDEEDIETKDIRLLPELLKKGNPSYLEILFSKEKINCFDKPQYPMRYETIINKLFYILWCYRETIVRCNLKNLYNATLGMMIQKYKHLYKPTEKTKRLFDVCGYDVKNALHIVRLGRMLTEYLKSDFKDYEDCVTLKNLSPEDKEFLFDIKKGTFDKEFIDDYCTNVINDIKLLQNDYYNAYNEDHKLLCDVMIDKLFYELIYMCFFGKNKSYLKWQKSLYKFWDDFYCIMDKHLIIP